MEETHQTVLPSIQAHLRLKAIGVTGMEDYDTSHCYIDSFFIVAALFLEIGAIE